jgi:integrase
VDTTGHAHLYRLEDLLDSGAGFLQRRPASGGSSGTSVGGRYSHSTLSEVRRTLVAVLDYAESEGIAFQPKPRAAQLPIDRTPEAKTRALTLAESARIASRLHAIHQLVLWWLRLLGLRISEVLGCIAGVAMHVAPGA